MKIILCIFALFLISDAKEFKISKNADMFDENVTKTEVNNPIVESNNVSKHTPPKNPFDNNQESSDFKEKAFSDIKYTPDNEWFSIVPHNEEEYNKMIKSAAITSSVEKKLSGKTSSVNAILLNAYKNDYKLQNPSIAENYYSLFQDTKGVPYYDQSIRYSDYMMRTNRPEKILEILNTGRCSNNYSTMYLCYYYIGVAKYLIDGDRTSTELRLAKDVIPKAKEIYKK
jgi:hypothetical protein